MSSYLDATRTAYDTVAASYAAQFTHELADRPTDQGLLSALGELARPVGPVLDLGCGPGVITSYLSSLGLEVSGLDLSPQMLAQARQTYPELRFEQGTMTALELPDASLGGIVAWYSTIHIPQPDLAGVLAELHRVLRPGGWVALAFQIPESDEIQERRRDEAFGHEISLVYYLRPIEVVAETLVKAGLTVHLRARREPTPDEGSPRGYLLAYKPR